jgi:hypothetical protein
MSIAEGKKPGYFYTRLLLTFTFTDVSNENCCLDRPQKTSNKKERSFTSKGKKKSNNKKRNKKKSRLKNFVCARFNFSIVPGDSKNYVR